MKRVRRAGQLIWLQCKKWESERFGVWRWAGDKGCEGSLGGALGGPGSSCEGSPNKRITLESPKKLGDKWKAMKGDKWRKPRRQQHPTAGQNGDHEGGQMKGDKAAAQARMEITQGDKWRETRQQRQPRGDHAGRQMKGDKAAAAARSSPESRSGRETNEGAQSGRGITAIFRLWGSAT